MLTTSRRLSAAALLLPLALAACSSTPSNNTLPATAPAKPAAAASPSPSPTGEPKTYEAVKAAVDRIEAAAKAHDASTEWDMLTATGQATMSRADYIKVTQGCPKISGSNAVLSVALNSGGSSATITSTVSASQGGGTYAWQMVYENGRWKHQPSDGAMGWMGLGADKALTALHNDGAC